MVRFPDQPEKQGSLSSACSDEAPVDQEKLGAKLAEIERDLTSAAMPYLRRAGRRTHR